jgi:hypothetical protein
MLNSIYKGETEAFQELVGKINEETSYFTFSLKNLERLDQIRKNVYRISLPLQNELRKVLGEVREEKKVIIEYLKRKNIKMVANGISEGSI